MVRSHRLFDMKKTRCSTCVCYYLGPNNTYTCCAPSQIATMANQFGLAKLMLGRCPSCYYNFRSIFCSLSCGIDHSRYLTILEMGNSSVYENETTVEQVEYRMAGDFGQRVVDSCRFDKKNATIKKVNTISFLFLSGMYFFQVGINIHWIQCVVYPMINVQKKNSSNT